MAPFTRWSLTQGITGTWLVVMCAGAIGCQGPERGRRDDFTPGKNVVCSAVATGQQAHALRLAPDADLRREIEAYVREKSIAAGYVATCVGSLKRASIRLANRAEPATRESKFEIVSLIGTVGAGGVHLHVCLSDEKGETIGGHLLEGCIVYTTAEIVIVELPGLRFDRVEDPKTGFRELEIRATR